MTSGSVEHDSADQVPSVSAQGGTVESGGLPRGAVDDGAVETGAIQGGAAAHVVPDHEDPRPDLDMMAGERDGLEEWLEMYRSTVLLKIAGLTAEQLAARSVPPSTMSLLGVVRHLTEVEMYWFTDVAVGEDSGDLYSSREDPDGEFNAATAEGAGADVARYRAELDRARRQQARVTSLDDPVAGLRRGKQVNLRWIYVHLVEEYARHLGHMDLLREAIDGRTGY